MIRKGVSGIIVGLAVAVLAWWGINGFTENTSVLAVSEREEGTSAEEYPETDPAFLVGGVQMNEGDQQNWIKTLSGVGMNTVEVTIYAHQGRWNENNLWYPDNMPGLVEEIRLAKAAGLQVVMILRLQLDHAFKENKFLWHGMVYPETEYLLQRWFEEYNRFAKTWALVAEEEGVDLFVIGSEMNALFSTRFIKKMPPLESYYLSERKQNEYKEKIVELGDSLTSQYLYVDGFPNYQDRAQYVEDRSKANEEWAKTVTFPDSADQIRAMNVRRAIVNYYWERLIWDLRRAYHGKMTVAANFDNYRDIDFWDQLDCIGINAYFPLRSIDSLPHKDEMYHSWCRVLDEIKAFKEEMKIPDHPVILTELGYAEYSGATLAPWQGGGFSLIEGRKKDSLIIWDKQKRDLSERNAAVRALFRANREKKVGLAGILYWKFTTHDHQTKEDPFALHIGPESSDTLQTLLLDFKEESP